MKALFDEVSYDCSKKVTSAYSTSFSVAVKMLAPSVRTPIYSIYGFVRFADEIVDSFHQYNNEELLDEFENDLYKALDRGISLNPILNSFQHVVKQYSIDKSLIDSFLKSMRTDLYKNTYDDTKSYQDYIYGSADVVGLMCLKVFVNGDQQKYDELKEYAEKLGSAFQKVNFLRDLKDDMDLLNRSYFPNLTGNQLDAVTKQEIIADIENDLEQAYIGIKLLPNEAKFGVYTAYLYYKQLLLKLKKIEAIQIKETRIRVSNSLKLGLLVKSFVNYKLNLL
jgi:phytoene/squalene synthetase